MRDESGKIIGIFGISRDITERKMAEEQIRAQAKLLELVADAVIVRDMEDRISFWNAAAKRIYGWKAQEVIADRPKIFYTLIYSDTWKPKKLL